MAIYCADFDILGVTVRRCGPITGTLHLPLDGGLSALYGLNGAGKTRILRLLKEAFENTALTGLQEHGFVDIHVKLRPASRGQRQYNMHNSSARHFFSHLRQNLRAEVEEGIDRLTSAETSASLGVNPLALESAIPALLEACDEQRVTFRAWREHGDAGSGGHGVVLAVSPRSPAGAAFLAEAEQVFRKRRPANGEFDQAVLPPLASVGYWGSDSDPRWIGDVPADLQVPLDWHIGPTPSDFRLARIGGNLPKPFDPDDATQTELALLCGVLGSDYYEPGSEEMSEDLRFEMAEIENRANEMLSSVLAPAPTLSWSVPTPTELALGGKPRWVADEGWPLSHASEAQRRWMQFALEAAMPRGDEPFLLLLDEPESGLHRLAEHRIPSGLHSWATQGGASAVIVATHSPDLLSSPLANKILVGRSPQTGVSIRPVTVGLRNGDSGRGAAAEFGLSVGDLWAMSRLVVVVEGVHDEWVFNSLLGSELDGALAAVLPMHGGTRLRSLAEARMLMDGTDAEILVVLDDLGAFEGTKALDQIRMAALGRDVDELARALDDLRQRGRNNDSLLFLHQFLIRAAALGDLGRVQIHGLSLPDVICYLDPDTVLIEARPWDSLLKEWSAEAAPNQPKNLKGWLRRQRLLPEDSQLVDEAIEQAAVRMSTERRPLHPDLVSLGARIAELGAGGYRLR